MGKYINIISYIPEYLKSYGELKSILDTETAELAKIEELHNKLIADRYISTCSEQGVMRFERILSIEPLLNDTLDNRRFRCITKWNSTIPYNYTYLTNKLNILCGADGYTIVQRFNDYSIDFYIDVKNEKNMESVKESIFETIPCNMVWRVKVIYRTWSDALSRTYSEVERITWDNLRRGENIGN